MTTTLAILGSSGDTKLTWDHADPTQCEEVRRTVADLKSQGYTFFLVDGTVADEVSAGGGTLLVRKLSADEVAGVAIGPPAEAASPADPSADEPSPAPKRRGRPPKARPEPTAADRNVVAVRPIQGG